MMPVYLALTGAILYASAVRSPRAYAIALAGFAWPLAAARPVARAPSGGLHRHDRPATTSAVYGHIGSAGWCADAYRDAYAASPPARSRRASPSGCQPYWTFFDPSYLFVYGGYTRLTNTTRHAGLFLLPLHRVRAARHRP